MPASAATTASARPYGGLAMEERVAARRARFIEAGIELFGTQGFRGATVRGICAAAGLTDRYFYESFASLEALLADVYGTVKDGFARRLMDESFGAQYESDRHFQQLFTLFSILAIAIACLGLFGLSTFMAQQRVKEIGIRKVLGSSATSIVLLLSKDFIKLVILAGAVAIPLCWWAMNQWLQGFAYRITIGPLVFIGAGMIALAVAVITIAWQSVKAARANPVKSLRTE